MLRASDERLHFVATVATHSCYKRKSLDLDVTEPSVKTLGWWQAQSKRIVLLQRFCKQRTSKKHVSYVYSHLVPRADLERERHLNASIPPAHGDEGIVSGMPLATMLLKLQRTELLENRLS